jgi:hypothetical protein
VLAVELDTQMTVFSDKLNPVLEPEDSRMVTGMGWGRRLRCLATVAALAILVPAAVVSAEAPKSTPEAVEAARFKLQASNGFEVEVDAGHGKVRLTFDRLGKHRRDIVQYLVDGEVSAEGITAQFGSLGTIDVRFRQTGTTKGMGPPAGCDGYYVNGRKGVFTGSIRFRGEEGFVRINATRAVGETGISTRWNCERAVARRLDDLEREEEERAREYGHLVAKKPGSKFFRAVGGPDANGKFGPGFFLAATFERQDSMRIARVVEIEDFAAHFRFDEDLRAAAVRPGAPFFGNARFDRGSGMNRWSGSLSVSLPGRAAVKLTGSGFRSQLSHDLPGD